MSDSTTAAPRKVAPAAPSSTIVLMRDAAAGPEVLMVVRHHQIDFASGALVFPGGKLDPQDDSDAAKAMVDGAPMADVALRIGAIREAYEESGILLANTADGRPATPELLATLEDDRKRVHAGELPFAALLTQANLRLRCDELVHFAHWITPEMMPKRFDTHFYIVRVPPDQVAAHDGRESVDSVWLTPADAIAEEYSVVYGLPRHALDQMRREYPALAGKVLFNISGLLADRLRTTTDELRAAIA